ncbi:MULTISPECIES: aminoglycoside phosphotransferase family protein [unclassified Kitasatospora]|uniref:phosphotransferase family protein n=1 Tax=unclassified Kitasatospora TaxID=2633591 RepID=UPI0033DA3132
MTTPILDHAAASRLIPGTRTLSARPLPQGRFNTCWRLDGSGRSYLLKLNHREGEPHLRRMADAMTDAAARGVTVPRVLDVGHDRDLGPYLLQEWIDGRTFAEARQADAVDPNMWPAIGHQIALLHTEPVPGAAATPASRTRQLSDLLTRLDQHALIPDGLAEAARRRGTALAEQLGDHPMVNTHQDIHPDNILIRPGGQIALLDFDHATTAEDASDFVKIDRWCLTSPEDRRLLLDAYWQQRGQPADPRFEQRLAFHRLVIHLSYFLYWHGRDPAQIPGCRAALRDELE